MIPIVAKLTRFRTRTRRGVKRARAWSVARVSLSRWQQWDLWRPTWRTSTLALIRYEPKLFLNDYRSMLTSPIPSPCLFSISDHFYDKLHFNLPVLCK